MHGFSSGSSLLVNAGVDSMGGVVDSGVGISTETSPRQAAIVKTQAELRLEHDVREERRRELAFLEKGGNPLDFKIVVMAPVSVQSSSLADQLFCEFRTCEAKGSFSVAASPHGDSIGSSGRQGATVACEPNSADNFDGENGLIESVEKPTYAARSNITPSENSSQLDVSQNVRESENSPNFQPKKAYRRRNRSKTNRDSARSSSIGFRGGHSSFLSDCQGAVPKVVHESPSNTQKSDLNATPAGPINGGSAEDELDLSISKHMHDDPHKKSIDVRASTAMDSVEPDSLIGREQTTCAVREFQLPTLGSLKPENDGVPEQLRESDQGDVRSSQTEGIVSSVAVIWKGLDSESSCTQTSVSADRNGNLDSGLSSSHKKVASIKEQLDQELPLELRDNITIKKVLTDGKESDVAHSSSCVDYHHLSQNYQASEFSEKNEGTRINLLSVEYEAQCMPSAKPLRSSNHTNVILAMKKGSSDDTIYKVEGVCTEKPQQPQNTSNKRIKTDISCSVSVLELTHCAENQTAVVDKECEERILEEARNINAKRKTIRELALGSMAKDYRRKSHWDFVLEEMAWMANDFAQERVWKRTAATQLCYRAAYASRLRSEEQNKYERDKVVARSLAKSVADFWNSAALHAGEDDNNLGFVTCEKERATSQNNNSDRDGNEYNDKEYRRKNIKLAVQSYAVRFLQHNGSIPPIVKDASSETSEGVSTMGVPEPTCQNQHTEENLFYLVPHRAMEAYRRFVTRYLMQCERASKNMQEDVISSTYEAVTGLEYEENEGENMYYLPGAFEGSMVSNLAQKKLSNPKLYNPRLYEVGGDFSYEPCVEYRSSGPQSAIKRPTSGLNVCSIPTKRVRTASRQRVVGPFRSGAAGFMSLPSRTDASSGDTNSFQDDQSTQHESFIPKGLEVESGMDYDKQEAYDTEIAVRSRKKKKTKHQTPTYEPRWQVDCSMQIEQRGHIKKRSESHQFDSNGNSGPFGPHAKRPKIMKQSLGNSFENTTLMSGSVASPVGSLMSNMSNPNKLIRLIGGRDRGRKTKSLKMPSGQAGSGTPWSLFEDQALVVLVHDMGPNWELVSDAINSTLHFKCIFRKPKECKERHRALLEKSCGDGADTEDSGSSQPYPSTLPGIPKGGARQLFQQLRGPVEEDTIKSHFEKIILIGQDLHGIKMEPKQLVSTHSSHLAALSQVITINQNGGILTPLDFCDMDVSSPDIYALSHQGPHTGSLPLPNQGAVQSMLPSSTITSYQGSASVQPNGTVRDGRYGIPRTHLIDEQQRVQQYNHMVSDRNSQQPNMSIPGTFSANDRGPRGGELNRSMSMPRPGMQGVSSSYVPSSGSMSASNTVAMTSSLNMHSAGQGNSVLRPRDGHLTRPGQSQMMSSETQMQGSHINNQGVSAFGGLSSTFPSPVHHHHQHQIPRPHSNILSNSHHPHLQGSSHPGSSAEQQALAMRLARDRQLQQRMLQRQQQQQNLQHHQQLPSSNALMSHLPTQPQLQSQAASLPVSMSSLMTPSSPITPVTSQQQPKHQIPHHGVGQTAQIGTNTIVNQVEKQRQRPAQQSQQSQQQLQKSGRNHPPQRQPSQSQQTKVLKGMGRGNMSLLQSHSIDSSHPSGLSAPGPQLEKGVQGQCIPTQLSKPVVPPPQKLNSNSAPASFRQVQQRQSHPDSSNNPKQAAALTSTSVQSPIAPSPSHQQLNVHIQPSSKLVNGSELPVQKEVSQNCISNSDSLVKPQIDQRQAEQQLENNTSSIGATSGTPCGKPVNALSLASSAGSAQLKTSEPLGDSVAPKSEQVSIGSPPMSNSSRNEPVAPG